jgi:hypothetical protein
LSGLSAAETVVVEASSDLLNWTPIQTNTVRGALGVQNARSSCRFRCKLHDPSVHNPRLKPL